MRKSWRPLALAAALIVVAGFGVADAQTVVVRNAPPGSTIELAFNAATIGSATANAAGEATLPVKGAGDTEKDAHIYVDVCGKMRRVLFVERYGQPPAPGNDCDRKEIAGFFVMRRVTTFVVDMGGDTPMVWLRQGPAPAEWLTQTQEQVASGESVAIRRPSPTGFVLSGGGGFTTFGDVVSQACGNVVDCSGKDFNLSYTVGVAYWLTRFLAAEGTFVKPLKLTISGSGDVYRFNTTFDPRIYTIGAKAGVPIGPVRFYGQAGMNYHEATLTTSNTIDDKTIVVDDTQQTIPGGTQTFELKTRGWGWLFGGGFEGWVGRRAAIYAEVTRAKIKGNAQGAEGGIDDRATFILFGARVHVGG